MKKILEELIIDVSFQPFMISIDNIMVIIHLIDISQQNGWHNAGPGFSVFLVHFHAKQRAIFFCGFEEHKAFIKIYKENECENEFYGKNPHNVWLQTGILKTINGISLFGLDNPIVQQHLEQACQLICLPQNWHNSMEMEKLFNYHLKK